ncbi:MAG: PEP-CTERM system TPR-repeat protein PrsT [Candidatus Thiodiazotropha sp. (ex Monitilora ramsayi)]|nr:PEP-CTERM system TPR-repeat protein PrsT [Candidatus Thiodiazotropha sp. (ex Monitilora ramsayi)]
MKLPNKPLSLGFFVPWILITVFFISGCNLFTSNEERFRKAVDHQEKGEVNAAIIEFKNVIKSDPEHAQARLLLGKAYLKINDGAGAKKELLRARSLGVVDSDLAVELAKAYLLTDELDEAQSLLEETPSLPQDGETLTLKGDVVLALGRIAEAKRHYQASLSSDPTYIRARYGLVRLALRENNNVEASQQIKKILDLDESDFQGLIYLAEVELNQGNPQAAIEAYKRALKTADNTFVRIGLARAYLAVSDTESADRQLDAVAEREPENLVVSYLKAVSAYQRNDLSTAKTLLLEVVGKAPDHYPSLLLLGSVHFHLAEYEQAINNLVRYLAQDESHVRAKKVLAQSYVKLGDLDRAIERLESAADTTPNDPELMMMLGNLYTGKGDYASGESYYNKAMKLAPGVKEIETRMAINRWASGDHDQAIADLNTITESEQAYLPADIALITAHMQSKEFQQALDVSRKLIEKKPDMPIGYALAAAAQEAMGAKAEAVSYLEQSLQVDPGYMNGYLLLARMALKEGDVQRARRRLEQALTQQPNDEKALLMLATLEEQAGNKTQATKLVEQARAGNPRAVTPRVLLANAALGQGKIDEARALTQEALTIAPSDISVVLLQAELEQAAGDNQAALKAYEKVLEINPGAFDVAAKMAGIMAKLGDLAGAQRVFESILAQKADHIGAQWALGGIALQQGKPKLAAEYAERLIKQHDASAAGYSLKGDVMMSRKQFEGALAAYREAFSRSEGRMTLAKITQSLQTLGRKRESLEMLDQWLEKRPEDIDTRLSYATQLQSLGDDARAIAEYQEILQRKPDHPVAMNNLAWLYYTQGSTEKALDLAKRAHQIAPSVPGIIDTYGWILVNNNQVDAGLKLLEEARAKRPEDLDIRYHLAAAHARAGNSGFAKSELEEILASNKGFSEKQNAADLLNSLR